MLETRFEDDRAIRARAIFERLLVHTKGRHARQPFLLAAWQWEEIIRPLFGWTAYDAELDLWVRLYRLLWLELGRKNGKSELLAAIAIILTGADDEEGAEVYGAAKDITQASLVFDVAARMLELAGLAARDGKFKIYRRNKRIVYLPTSSFYQVIPADATGNLGQNPHGIVFDEILAQPNRELWDALRTGFGARAQPLMVAATTAGDDPYGFAFSEHDFSRRVAEDSDLDPRRLVVIHAVPEKIENVATDPFDEALWPLANPALITEKNPDGFLSPQVLRDEAKVARENPAALKSFKMYRLNQWQEQHATPWLGLDKWDATAGVTLTAVDSIERFAGLSVIVGLDLAATQDTTSVVYIAENPALAGEILIGWRFWIPETRLSDLEERTAGLAPTWVREGWLELTEGDVTDYRKIVERLATDQQGFREIAELGFDRWGAQVIVNELTETLGVDVTRVGQGYVDMSPGMKELERLILGRKLAHGGNPVARWQFQNVVVRTDPAENIKPDRQSSRDKIDGMVAAVMAVGRYLSREPKKKTRVASF